MVKRQTWVLLAVFAALIGLAFFWTQYQNDRKKAHPTATPTPELNLFTIDSAAIASLNIVDNASGKSVSIGRDAAGQWVLVEPQADYTDIASVEAAVSQLASLRVLTSLPTTDNLAEYGLDNPAYTITIVINGGQQVIAQVGSPTATSNGYYVLTPVGTPQIVSKSSMDAVLKLLQKPPIATPTVAPTLTGTIEPAGVTTTTPSAPTSTSSPLPAPTGTPLSTPTAAATSVAVTPTETSTP